MIYLAITPEGLAQALAVASKDDAVWCGCDAIDEAAYNASPPRGLSRFDYSLGGDDAAVVIAGALSTIEEHHPAQTIWVEATPAT